VSSLSVVSLIIPYGAFQLINSLCLILPLRAVKDMFMTKSHPGTVTLKRRLQKSSDKKTEIYHFSTEKLCSLFDNKFVHMLRLFISDLSEHRFDRAYGRAVEVPNSGLTTFPRYVALNNIYSFQF
jgi:hypothetical protein